MSDKAAKTLAQAAIAIALIAGIVVLTCAGYSTAVGWLLLIMAMLVLA